MNKNILFGILLCLIPLVGISQVSVSIEPENFIMSGKPSETNIYFDVEVINTSGQMANVLWSKRLSNAPSGWWSWVCDINRCYEPETISCPEDQPNPIAPGDTIELQMHLNPRGIEGTGEYTVNLVDLDGTILGSITGNVQISLTSSSNQAQHDSKLSLFPNPTTDYFQTSDLPELNQVEVFNLTGRKIKSFDASPEQLYYVGDLSEGVYLVALVASSGKRLKTVRLTIQ